MYLEQWENGCITMLLTDKELSGMGLTFQNMDKETALRQDGFRHLLSAVRRQAGWSADHRLQVEILPVENGCLLLITPRTARRSIHIRRLPKPLVYRFARFDDLLDMAAMLPRHPAIFSSSLYRFREEFRLIVIPIGHQNSVVRVLSEYGEPVGKGNMAAAITAEHGTALAIGDGVDQLIQAVNPQITGNEEMP